MVLVVFECLIAPVAYGKIWYNLLLILRNKDNGSLSATKSLTYCFVWAFLGPVIMLWLVAKDTNNLLVIFVHHDGFTRTMEEKKNADKADDELKIQVYNQVRAIAI